MPDLIRFYSAHQAQKLVLHAENSADNFGSAQQFIREKAMPFPVLFDPGGSVGRIFGVDGLPSTFLIDASLVIWRGGQRIAYEPGASAANCALIAAIRSFNRF